MTLPQREHPEAVAEFDAAVRWYEAQEPPPALRRQQLDWDDLDPPLRHRHAHSSPRLPTQHLSATITTEPSAR